MEAAELYRKVRSEGGLVDLSDRARFQLRGADRVRFLNGQISNAVRGLAPGETRPACVMTAKGKMSAFVQYSAAPDFLRIDAPGIQRDELAARLERYMIADDVELVDISGEEALFHVFGPARDHMPEVGERSRSRRFGMEGCDIYVRKGDAPAVYQQLGEVAPVVSDEVLEVLRIEAGIPNWGAELDENTIPVEAGLQETAIDYAKGCYIGQEVISRLKSIGHVNRQLRGFVAGETGALEAGMLLMDPANPGKPAGTVTSAAHSFALARRAGLGYVKRGVSTEVLHAVRPDDPARENPVEVRLLPLIS